MENGHIVEVGNHDELLAAGGAYARLYQSQFENPIDEEQSVPADTGQIILAEVLANRAKRSRVSHK